MALKHDLLNTPSKKVVVPIKNFISAYHFQSSQSVIVAIIGKRSWSSCLLPNREAAMELA